MSRLFEALQHSETEVQPAFSQQPSPKAQVEAVALEPMPEIEAAVPQLEHVRSLRISPDAESDLPFFADPTAIAFEKFRLLAFRLRQAQERSHFKRVLVTSSVVQDGKSLVSANLAVTLAEREKQKVLLIEGDLRLPRLGQIFGVGRLAGLADWADQQNRPFTDFLYRLGESSLWLLPAGRGKLSPLEVLNSEGLARLMEQLSGWFDCIVIDSPPLVPLADAHVWETLAEATLLVVREGKTPKKMLEKSLEALDRNKLIGAVLNEATLTQHKYYHYYDPSRAAGTPPVSEENKN
jgi:capsular exopolysaccharide synthesis family protein